MDKDDSYICMRLVKAVIEESDSAEQCLRICETFFKQDLREEAQAMQLFHRKFRGAKTFEQAFAMASGHAKLLWHR